MHPVLVLNADSYPLTVIGWKRAIRLLYEEKVQMLDFYAGLKIRDTKGRAYPVPSVIMLTKYVRRDYTKPPFSSRNLKMRDRHTCQYCGGHFAAHDLTLDHVIPKSRWTGSGPSKCWENVVACCGPCNRRKADRTCREAGMFPLAMPARPSYGEIFLGIGPSADIPAAWMPYLSSLSLFRNPVHEQQQAAQVSR